MQPLPHWPLKDRRQLVGIFTDIDDTLSTEGVVTADALRALHDLKAAGLHVVPITGRPIGWCEPLARGDAKRGITPWPVDAIVAANGAVAVAPQKSSKIGLQPAWNVRKPLSKLYQQDAVTRADHYARMQAVAQQGMREVPGATLAQDSAGRETDIAFDHSEFTHLPPDAIARVVAILQASGMHATVSSIHINGWFGSHNKWQGACWIVRELWGRDLQAEIGQWAYVGDSTNDQLMFQHFDNSVGVANIRRFEAELAHVPRYITPSAHGAGFAEVAHSILEAHRA